MTTGGVFIPVRESLLRPVRRKLHSDVRLKVTISVGFPTLSYKRRINPVVPQRPTRILGLSILTKIFVRHNKMDIVWILFWSST